MTSHSGQLNLLTSSGLEMSTGQRIEAVRYGWEGNRRSGVLLALHHRDPGLCITALATFSVKHRTTTTQAQSCNG